ncbi:hypothetical protein A3I55_05740 [Candidatus Woesebacteria bacterium RIFCSPLOWO2_02_FULL_42_10]|nr:MAG: hypothetical protein A3I55_05740 [Candidatus Woesebacteria bacterium RIFCSPLOWO2_02_FULL_42_10]
MIKYSLDLNFKTPIYLIYSNSTPEEIAFRSDLDEMAKNNENIKVAMTISKPEESQVYWPGLTGRIDDKLLHKLFANWKLAINQLTFWVAGPPPMVDAIEILLASSNINPDHIKIEKFTGY